MRNLFARIIVEFARFITFPFLRPTRRADALMRAASRLIEGGKIEVNTKNGRMFFVPAARLSSSSAMQTFAHEPETVDWIEAFADGTVFWDIGANIGVFALYAA